MSLAAPAPARDLDRIETLERVPLGAARMFVSRGAGPALLFVHGGYHGAWCWMPLLRIVAERGVAAAAVDLRGHGGLPQGPQFVTEGVREMAADVVAAARALGGPVILVGHSVGALVAMAAAADLALAGLVLLAPSPPGQLAGLQPIDPYPEGAVVPPPPAEVARRKFLGGADGDLSDVLSRLCPESPRLLNDRYRLRIRIERESVRAPVLCLSAGRDLPHLHPPGQDEATAAFFGAEYHRLPDAAHDMMLCAARHEVARRVLDWMGRRVAPA